MTATDLQLLIRACSDEQTLTYAAHGEGAAASRLVRGGLLRKSPPEAGSIVGFYPTDKGQQAVVAFISSLEALAES